MPTQTVQAVHVRNHFRGMFKGIIRGDVDSDVDVDVETPWRVVISVITTRSVDPLELVLGSEMVARVRSSEVSIAKL